MIRANGNWKANVFIEATERGAILFCDDAPNLIRRMRNHKENPTAINMGSALFHNRIIIGRVVIGEDGFSLPADLTATATALHPLIRDSGSSFAHITIAGGHESEFHYEREQGDLAATLMASDPSPFIRYMRASSLCADQSHLITSQKIRYCFRDGNLPASLNMARRCVWALPGVIRPFESESAELICVQGVKGFRFSMHQHQQASGWTASAAGFVIGSRAGGWWCEAIEEGEGVNFQGKFYSLTETQNAPFRT